MTATVQTVFPRNCIDRETEKAVGFFCTFNDRWLRPRWVWMPKKLVTWETDDNGREVAAVPRWFAAKLDVPFGMIRW